MPPRPKIVFRILESYGIDWALAILIALFSNFYLDRFQNIPDFSLTDTSIQFAFKEKEVFPNSTLAYILVFSYVLVVISNLILSRNMWDLHHALLGLTVAFALVGTFVEIVRITTLLLGVNPFENAANGHFFGLANITVCQTPATDPLIKDGMRSFFSGHACLSAVGLGFNSLYWAGKLQLFNRKAYTSKAWLVFSPLLVSIYICITRVTDHRHHPSDAALGFAVGLFPTYIFYRQFYPALEDPNCNLAYPPRHLAAESDRGPARTWGPRGWFSTADRDDGPTPLLPTNRSTRGMRGSTSNLGHAEVELDSGLIATPYASELGHGHDREMVYSGMPKSPDHSST